jgi:hypothetical protein
MIDILIWDFVVDCLLMYDAQDGTGQNTLLKMLMSHPPVTVTSRESWDVNDYALPGRE